MKRKIEQERIPGFVGSTANQRAPILAHALSISPVPYRVPLRQTNRRRGQWFTECFDSLQRDLVNKHKYNLENLLRAPVAGLASPAGPAGPADPAAPVAAVNARKSSQNICTE